MLLLLIAIAAALFVVERLWPAQALPRVQWDALFGTFRNPRTAPPRCGYDEWREDRFEDMLAFRDVHTPGMEAQAPLNFLPTCIGCSKRWACAAQQGRPTAARTRPSHR